MRGHWSKHFWALLCSAFQQLGTFFYWGSEWSDGFIHMPAFVRLVYIKLSSPLIVHVHSQDWPPQFDTYLKLKYFWFVFVFLNGIWVVIPFYVYYRAYKQLGALIGDNQNAKTKKH